MCSLWAIGGGFLWSATSQESNSGSTSTDVKRKTQWQARQRRWRRRRRWRQRRRHITTKITKEKNYCTNTDHNQTYAKWYMCSVAVDRRVSNPPVKCTKAALLYFVVFWLIHFNFACQCEFFAGAHPFHHSFSLFFFIYIYVHIWVYTISFFFFGFSSLYSCHFLFSRLEPTLILLM